MGRYTYDPAEDALRVNGETASESEYREWLTYEFTDRQPDRATVALEWERLQVPIKIAVEHVDDLYVAQIKRELRNRDGYSWDNWEAAAEYCLDTQDPPRRRSPLRPAGGGLGGSRRRQLPDAEHARPAPDRERQE